MVYGRIRASGTLEDVYIPPYLMEIEDGDYIQLSAQNTTTGNSVVYAGDFATWITVEAVEYI